MSQQQYQAEVMDELRMQEELGILHKQITSMTDKEFYEWMESVDKANQGDTNAA